MAELGSKVEVNDLSLLSLLAAHEIEKLQRQEPSDGRYLSELGDRLEAQISGPSPADVRSIAPSTVQLYRHAVHVATKNDPRDFATLRAEITNLLDELRSASEKAKGPGSAGDLNSLLAFVSAIHRQLLTQKQRAYASRRTGRYRV